MADRIKPSDFPLRPTLTGAEELYTQTNGINEKFLVDQVVDRANSKNVTPLEFTFTNVTSYTGIHNFGRQPVSVRVVEPDGMGNEEEIVVQIKTNTTTFTILSNTPITGKAYLL